MALWPVAGQSRVATTGGTAATTLTVTVTGSATPHTMGSWTTLVASTPFAVDGITLHLGNTATSTVDTSTLADIGLGAAASERMLVAGIPVGFVQPGTRSVFVPIQVPAGERIAARVQSAVASKAVAIGLVLSGDAGWQRAAGCAASDSYGVVSASSSGTTLTDTASQHVKAAWTEITSGTTRRHRFLLPLPTLVAGDTSITSSDYLYDIGIGTSGSEQIIAPNLFWTSNAVEETRMQSPQPLRYTLPAGTRLACRFQKLTTAAEPMAIVLVGLD